MKIVEVMEDLANTTPTDPSYANQLLEPNEGENLNYCK